MLAAVLTLTGCGPAGNGPKDNRPANKPPAAGDAGDTVTFWIHAYGPDNVEYVQNVGLTLTSLDNALNPVTFTDQTTGKVYPGVQEAPAGTHTPFYWTAILNPGVHTVELTASAVMPKDAYLVCDVRRGGAPAGQTPDPHAPMISSDQSDPASPSGAMPRALVLLTCSYPSL